MMVTKKKFFEIELPLVKDKIKLLAFQISDLKNKKVKLDLTRRLRGKSLEATFNILVDNEKASAEIQRLLVLPYFIRRMMRKSVNYVEDSFSTKAKDAEVKVKPFLITRKKVHRSVRKELRDKAKSFITEDFKTRKIEEIFEDLIAGKYQRSLSLRLKKIYPLSLCEIRDIKILKREEKPKVKEEKVK